MKNYSRPQYGGKQKGWNRNIMGGKRPNKGITKYGRFTLGERIMAEGKATREYEQRVNQCK